jgi:hypothetical protein
VESFIPNFKGRFVIINIEEFSCPDVDCRAKTNLIIRCPACEKIGKEIIFHDYDEARNHFENFYKDEEIHKFYDPFKEITLEDVYEALDTTIKRDQSSKGITLFCMLNAQTENDSFNEMFSASSSTGKTYIPEELAAYFPDSEIVEYAEASPTSFFHMNGTSVIEREDRYERLSDVLEPLEEELQELQDKSKDRTKEENKRIGVLKAEISKLRKEALILVDLEGKIVIFLDQPNVMLLKKLRSFLSHDKKELRIAITDSTGHGGHRTKQVILRGYASLIFCTSSMDYSEQENNRTFILSPESDLPKIEEALKLLDSKLSNREKFKQRLLANDLRQALVFRIEMIRSTGIRKIVTEEGVILQRFRASHKHLQPRAARDLTRIFALSYGHALLNAFNRRRTDGDELTIEAEDRDIDAAFSLYEPIMQSNELGLSPEAYSIFNDVILPAYKEKVLDFEARRELTHKSNLSDRTLDRTSENRLDDADCNKYIGLNYVDAARAYQSHFHRPIKYDKLKDTMEILTLAGLLDKFQDGEDKRRALFRPIGDSE